MLDPSLNEYITNELKRYPHPSNITLELIETQAIANYSEVKAFISMVKSKGVKVIIDDFGSGAAIRVAHAATTLARNVTPALAA